MTQRVQSIQRWFRRKCKPSLKTALYTIVQRKQKNKITHHPDHIRSRLEHGKDKAHLGDRLIKDVDTCSLYEQICTNRPDHNVACPVDPCVVKIRHNDRIGTGIAILCVVLGNRQKRRERGIKLGRRCGSCRKCELCQRN